MGLQARAIVVDMRRAGSGGRVVRAAVVVA